MKLSYLLLISTCMVQLSLDVHAGKRDLLPNEEPGYEKKTNLSRNTNHTLPYKPEKSSTSSLYQETVLNPDNDRRVRITETKGWPYSMNGQLRVHFPSNRSGYGSGTLIGPHHFLTAAHCVYNEKDNEWADTVNVRLGLNEDEVPFGKIKVKEIYTFKEWDESQDMDFDMALLVLNKSIGLTSGWSGLRVVDDADLQDKNVSVIGYPGDKGSVIERNGTKYQKCDQLWGMAGKIRDIHSDRLFYDLDTNKGQSGSGVLIDHLTNPYLIGTHTLGTDAPEYGNSGVRLSQDKFDQVVQWMAESCQIKLAPVVNPLRPGSTVNLEAPLFEGIRFVSAPNSDKWKKKFKAKAANRFEEEEKSDLCQKWEDEQELLTSRQQTLESKGRYKKGRLNPNSSKRRKQIGKMKGQGIFVSEDLNSAGNFALLREQIVAKKNALAESDEAIRSLQDVSDITQTYIERFNELYSVLNDPDQIKDFFEAQRYNDPLSRYNVKRYQFGCILQTERNKEIKRSCKDEIPLEDKLTTTSNLKREAKIIKKQDDALWLGFEVEAHRRVDKVDAENKEVKSKNKKVNAENEKLKAKLRDNGISID